MKIKQLLGMLVLDDNANEIGKIIDADFEPETGAITKIVVSLKKNFLTSDQLDVEYGDVKSIGDYVLLKITIDKETKIKEAEEAKKAEKEAKKEAKKAEREAKKAAKEAEKEEAVAEQIEKQVEVVEAEIVDDAEEAEEAVEAEETTDVKVE